jgi:hypothetical protein
MPPHTSSTRDDRFDEEVDWTVLPFISPAALRQEPEEYVAQHAHSLGAFSFCHRTAISPGPR